VYHRPPRRRLLGDIQLLHGEVSAAYVIRSQQHESRRQFGWVSHPSTFRISSQSRNQQYDLELDLDEGCQDQLNDEIDDLSALLELLTTLEQKARYRIDVLEEDNSKTIFVFTFVTAVFLPLSFVTSYLGMNTVDIRNTNNTQKLFWAISLPVTVAVVSLAVMAAYKGDSIREWLFVKRQYLKSGKKEGVKKAVRGNGDKEKSRVAPGLKLRKSSRATNEEEVDYV